MLRDGAVQSGRGMVKGINADVRPNLAHEQAAKTKTKDRFWAAVEIAYPVCSLAGAFVSSP